MRLYVVSAAYTRDGPILERIRYIRFSHEIDLAQSSTSFVRKQKVHSTLYIPYYLEYKPGLIEQVRPFFVGLIIE